MSRMLLRVIPICIGCFSWTVGMYADSVGDAIEQIASIGDRGDGYEQAVPAAGRLRELHSSQLTRIFEAMNDSPPVAQNWFRGIIRDVVRQSGPPSSEQLIEYIKNRQNDPLGRHMALAILAKEQAPAAKQIIADSLDDPSFLIREQAVTATMEKARSLAPKNAAQAIASYRDALAVARHPTQLSSILAALKDLGEKVTTADAFTMITAWKVVAPFNNQNEVGYAHAYDPEARFIKSGKVDLSASYQGKNGSIQWQSIRASGDDGNVDLAKKFDQEKGAVAYLYAEFHYDQAVDAEARLACINANKVWVNGQLVIENDVQHSGTMIDQYVAGVPLQVGVNQVLLKICQNEQTEPWAQRWQFQFRFTDKTGKGLASTGGTNQ